MSKLFLPTMREVPADAIIKSHQLMLRAGLIRKLAAGIYTYLPLGLKVVKKISRIVEEEMDAIGAQEILMPMVQPADLWRESGRFDQYGPELLRFKDRKDSWFCLGPTHEEVVTALVRDHIKSYKNLPLTLYQIQGKFRDEIRPRFGLMRGREFIMKDAYSFCADKESQDKVYEAMWDAYHRIFERCGLAFRAVRAATGSIGGDMSHEFQVLAQSGEDAIASCDACGFAANIELAAIKPALLVKNEKTLELFEQKTPGAKTIEEVAAYLNSKPEQCIKSLAYVIDDKLTLVLLRGDTQLSESKLKSALKADNVRLATEQESEIIGPQGFLGPLCVNASVPIVADFALRGLVGLIAGANKLDTHFSGVDVERDIRSEFLDLREAQPHDPCGNCGHPFSIIRGIEVGHIFYLGKKYSKTLHAQVQNQHGDNVELEMGCYGIGIGRTAAAAIEQNHDEKGIIWPKAIAPFEVHLVPLGVDEDLLVESRAVYESLKKAGIDVLMDDRDERAGVKLNDADLLGFPLRIALGKRGLKNRQLEVLKRREQDQGPVLVSLDEDYVKVIKELLEDDLS